MCARATTDAVHAALAPFAARGDRVVLAVSGGLDSMVLLDAASSGARDAIAGVATFDHATGPAATAAADFVVASAAARGLPVRRGRARASGTTEAAWRDARWHFLRAAACAFGATHVATAHTRDDQVETVVLRLLRDASAWGLAGLYAESPDVVRPFVGLSRATLAEDAHVHGVVWIDDPSNATLRHRRNRVRHELLPVLRRARPAIEDELLAVAASAARWRADVDAFIDAHVAITHAADGTLHVATSSLARYDANVWAALWPAVAARGRVRLDRRGVVRLTEFTRSIAAGAAVGRRIQLSGFVDVESVRGAIVLRRHDDGPAAPARGTHSL